MENKFLEYKKMVMETPDIYSKDIVRLMERVDYDFANREIYFDEELPAKIIELMETKFNDVREELTLEQKAMIYGFFGIKEKSTHKRVYKILFILVARGWGKSTFIGRLSFVMFFFIGKNTKIFQNFAYDKKQAQEVVKEWRKICQLEYFQKLGFEIRGRGENTTIVNEKMMQEGLNFEASIGTTESSSIQGKNFAGVICDEIHTWKDPGLFNDIIMGTKDEDSMAIMITTDGEIEDGFLDLMLNKSESFLNPKIYKKKVQLFKDSKETTPPSQVMPWIYKVDDVEKWDTEKEIKKANPSWDLPYFSSTRENIENAIYSVKFEDESEVTLFQKNLNIRTKGTNALFKVNDLDYNNNFVLKEDEFWFCGVDLAYNNDFNSVSFVTFTENKELKVINKSFTNKLNYERLRKKGQSHLKSYVRDGDLVISGDVQTNLDDIVNYIYEMTQKISVLNVGCDVAIINQFRQKLDDVGIDREYQTKVPQNATTLTEPIDILVKSVKQKQMLYNDNNCLVWQLLNAEKVEKGIASGTGYTIDNKNRNLKHDAVSSILTAISTRLKYNEKNETNY